MSHSASDRITVLRHELRGLQRDARWLRRISLMLLFVIATAVVVLLLLRAGVELRVHR